MLYIFYTKSLKPGAYFRLRAMPWVTFQGLSSHKWLVATTLESCLRRCHDPLGVMGKTRGGKSAPPLQSEQSCFTQRAQCSQQASLNGGS